MSPRFITSIIYRKNRNILDDYPGTVSELQFPSCPRHAALTSVLCRMGVGGL